MTTLKPRTVEEFEAYVRGVEGTLRQRWSGKQPFLSLDQDPSQRAKVLQGGLWIEPGTPQNPTSVYEGLAHDWIGAVYVPHTDVRKVLDVLQNFDRHQHIYPEVKRSHVVSRRGDDITGFWRLQRTQSVDTVVLDVKQEVHWQEVALGKWVCRAYAKDISEVEHPGTPQEQVLPPGRGRGFLWRLYAYWSIETKDDGVLAECRSISLSRDIPATLSWIIKPFIGTLPRDTLTETLRDTRSAAAEN